MTFIMNRSSRLFLTSILTYPPKVLSFNQRCYMSSNQRPMMLMNLPRIVYPNLFFTIRNFISRLLITGYFDPTFAIKPFSEGTRQALTVVSRLIGNGQFDELSGFVTQEVENKKNTYILN